MVAGLPYMPGRERNIWLSLPLIPVSAQAGNAILELNRDISKFIPWRYIPMHFPANSPMLWYWLGET
jgi:hypothetical protein